MFYLFCKALTYVGVTIMAVAGLMVTCWVLYALYPNAW